MFSLPTSPRPRRPWLRLALALAAAASACAGPGSVRADGEPPAPTPPPATVVDGPTTASDAARLLTQATFGSTDALIAQVQTTGVKRFIAQQMNLPASSHVAVLQGLHLPTDERNTSYAQLPWWTYAVGAPDQLRQRVAFALSEIMVVSALGPSEHAYGLSGYMDVLGRDGFTTFRKLLEDVTLSPEMGTYLNMRGNDVADLAKNTHPNENYAREVMQLFTIGLRQLNLDGTPQLDADGQPIPTFTQDTVTNFARVFTGWTFAPSGSRPSSWRNARNWLEPMVSFPEHHDIDKKTLLNGRVVHAGGTPASDLKAALDNLANHPNVGPFFGRLLIQRLVTSNPSPGYVYRVASVFNDNGRGVRGDLKAVITAILTDYEARDASWAARPNYGKQREPVVRAVNILRAFHAVTGSQLLPLLSRSGDLGQTPLRAPSVFNFFQPTYTVPGKMAERGLVAPEFQITTESTTISAANFLHSMIYNGPGSSASILDLSALQSLAGSPADMTAYLNTLLMAGQMSPEMQATLTTAIATINAQNAGERARTAVEIVATSPEFTIQK